MFSDWRTIEARFAAAQRTSPRGKGLLRAYNEAETPFVGQMPNVFHFQHAVAEYYYPQHSSTVGQVIQPKNCA